MGESSSPPEELCSSSKELWTNDMIQLLSARRVRGCHEGPRRAGNSCRVHPRRVSVAEVGWLWNAELEAKPRNEVGWGETEKGG